MILWLGGGKCKNCTCPFICSSHLKTVTITSLGSESQASSLLLFTSPGSDTTTSQQFHHTTSRIFWSGGQESWFFTRQNAEERTEIFLAHDFIFKVSCWVCVSDKVLAITCPHTNYQTQVVILKYWLQHKKGLFTFANEIWRIYHLSNYTVQRDRYFFKLRDDATVPLVGTLTTTINLYSWEDL